MKKIKLLVTLITVAMLSSCGFHTPYKNLAVNANIVTSGDNIFANELKKKFDQDLAQNLTIEIGAEKQTKQTSSYTSAGKANSYTLGISVDVKVTNRKNELLLSQELSANKHLSKMSSSQADRLQIEQAYSQIRSSIIKKLLRRLSKLDEN